ncbi:hypothetical protein ANACAC_03297 [Anaerostipes caccae L1-92]|uniref:Uncharacterized protein n=1 Tax=Anaerostipes caccae (strain DSM 14662 / CCUG 47493 / JCM 13470 / NCIMB 13811 / L1-92) TaxID=411490 RepID=B0MI60_ANACD|nr:hypothetical protein ANACAC_03318 [Anaerostipes caccae L1-92]EDR96166.1 hypothetical protein ANACAC_03297 [Anaerostipes caccae L1-92]
MVHESISETSSLRSRQSRSYKQKVILLRNVNIPHRIPFSLCFQSCIRGCTLKTSYRTQKVIFYKK